MPLHPTPQQSTPQRVHPSNLTKVRLQPTRAVSPKAKRIVLKHP